MSKMASKALRPSASAEALDDAWERIPRAKCDTCRGLAVWGHPLGGLRCTKCLTRERSPGQVTP